MGTHGEEVVQRQLVDACARIAQVIFAALVLLSALMCRVVYADPVTSEEILRELRQMRERINQLEKVVESQQEEISELKEAQGSAPSDPAPEGLETRLESFKDELLDIVAGEQSPLEISGFFDVTAQYTNERDNPFEFGVLELDLEYPFNEHYSISAALVWDDGTSDVGFGVVDYHWFDDNVPARGRIFDEPGFHIQAGRFDLPFGVDYQYFASPDRPNVSAPLTTERIQAGGYGSDGIRLYGSGKMFDYALYVTDTLYWDDGVTVGGRLAFFPSRDPYQLHRFGSNRFIEVGASYLQDMDRNGDVLDRVYGLDFTLDYGIFLFVAEWMLRESDNELWGRDADLDIGINLGERDESGFHITLVTDIEGFVKRPMYVFTRFDSWDPDYNFVLDEEDDTAFYRVHNTRRLTVGLGYNLTENIGLKIEYFDHLGTGTEEPDFNDRGVIAQLVASF